MASAPRLGGEWRLLIRRDTPKPIRRCTYSPLVLDAEWGLQSGATTPNERLTLPVRTESLAAADIRPESGPVSVYDADHRVTRSYAEDKRDLAPIG